MTDFKEIDIPYSRVDMPGSGYTRIEDFKLSPFVGVYDIGGDDLAKKAEELIHLLKTAGVVVDEARRCVGSKESFVLLVCGEAELKLENKDETGYHLLKGVANLDFNDINEKLIEGGLLPLEIMDDLFCDIEDELEDYYDGDGDEDEN